MMLPCLIEAEPITLAMRENFGPAIGSGLNFVVCRSAIVAAISGSSSSSKVGGANSVNAISPPKEIGLSPPLYY